MRLAATIHLGEPPATGCTTSQTNVDRFFSCPTHSQSTPPNSTRKKQMRIELTEYHEKAACLWCGKEQVGVTAAFDDGFLDGAICWRCLAQAARVRFMADQNGPAKVSTRKQQNS